MQKKLGCKLVNVKNLQLSITNFLNLEVIVETIKLRIWLWMYSAPNLKMVCFESRDCQTQSNFVMNILYWLLSPLLGGSGGRESDCILKELGLTQPLWIYMNNS